MVKEHFCSILNNILTVLDFALMETKGILCLLGWLTMNSANITLS